MVAAKMRQHQPATARRNSKNVSGRRGCSTLPEGAGSGARACFATGSAGKASRIGRPRPVGRGGASAGRASRMGLGPSTGGLFMRASGSYHLEQRLGVRLVGPETHELAHRGGHTDLLLEAIDWLAVGPQVELLRRG